MEEQRPEQTHISGDIINMENRMGVRGENLQFILTGKQSLWIVFASSDRRIYGSQWLGGGTSPNPGFSSNFLKDDSCESGRILLHGKISSHHLPFLILSLVWAIPVIKKKE